MEKGQNLRYILTQWPGRPVPVPSLLVPRACLVDDDVLLFGASRREIVTHDEESDAAHALLRRIELDLAVDSGDLSDLREVEVPEEAYLRELLPLDATDAAAVLKFCMRYGEVGRADHSDLPYEVVQGVRDRYDDDDTYRLPEPWAAIEDNLLKPDSRDSLRKIVLEWGISMPLNPWRVQMVSEVSLYRDVLEDLVHLWDYISGGLEATQLLASWHSALWPPPHLDKTSESGVHSGDAAAMLVAGLNAALDPFHVRLEQTSEDGSLTLWGSASANIYQILCLQLANHIAEHARYRRCAADDCGRPFVRKLGHERDRHRAHGVLHFCSDECANRQAQRDHRKKNRRLAEEAVLLHEQGLSVAELAIRLNRTEKQVEAWVRRSSVGKSGGHGSSDPMDSSDHEGGNQ